MPLFQEEAKKLASESVFSWPELERLFKSQDERDTLLKVTQILKDKGATNQAIGELVQMGDVAMKVLVKVAKYALTA